MDIIQKAIEKKLHVPEDKTLETQTWEDFQKTVCGKKIFLFGVGAGADFFLKENRNLALEGVIDNDPNKQGFCLGDFCGEAFHGEFAKLMICPIETLNRYDSAEICVLITSMNYYEQMIEQLKQNGVENGYVLLLMEANLRKQLGYVANAGQEVSRQDYAKLCCQDSIVPNKIIFYAFGNYADHGKYITEALLRIRDDLDIVWCVKAMSVQVPQGVRKVYIGNWKRYLWELETAKVWIYNMVVPEYVIKRPKQIYIQTKHWASVTLKKFYLDAETVQDVPENVAKWKYNSEIMDYIITGSDFDTKSARRGFDFHKEVWQIGSPRSDALFQQKKYKERIYRYYDLSTEAKILLYAPTYRFDRISKTHNHEMGKTNPDFSRVKEALEKRFGGIWYIMLRLHPSVERESSRMDRPDFVIDASSYNDSQELAAACDIMISDYSSIMFEPAFVQKPVFLFAVDKKEYIDREYDFLIDYASLPFPTAESDDELIQKIMLFQESEYKKDLAEFMDRYGVHEDGRASERAACRISELLPVPKITVLMPALNVKKYIAACMESVISQTFTDMEILVIDAGSDDGTLEILYKYTEMDDRIRVVHSDKKSYGYQLNMGITQARGEYVCIVETDDKIAPDMLKTLYYAAVQKDVDYVKGRAAQFIELQNGAEWIRPMGIPLMGNTDGTMGEVIAPKRMPDLYVRDIYLWTGLYKRNFIRKVILNETPGAAFQDQGFLFQTISTAGRALYLDKIVYYYRQDNNTSSIFNRRGFAYLVQEYSYIDQFLRQKDKKWTNAFYQRMWNQCLGRLRIMAASGEYWETAVADMNELKVEFAKALTEGGMRTDCMDAGRRALLMQYMQNPREAYRECWQELREKHDVIVQIERRLQDIGGEMVIFGCKESGRFLHAIMVQKNSAYHIIFCDNDILVQGRVIQGTEVLTPQAAVAKTPQALFVTTSTKHEKEMTEQLVELGVNRDRIISYTAGANILLFQNADFRN